MCDLDRFSKIQSHIKFKLFYEAQTNKVYAPNKSVAIAYHNVNRFIANVAMK